MLFKYEVNMQAVWRLLQMGEQGAAKIAAKDALGFYALYLETAE